MESLVKKILDNNQSIINDTKQLIEQVSKITTNKTEKYFSNIKEYVEEYDTIYEYVNTVGLPHTTDLYFEFINALELSLHIIDEIYVTFEKLINKTHNSDVYLSQTYINDTFELYKKIIIIYKKFNNSNNTLLKELIDMINSNEMDGAAINAVKYVLNIQSLLQKYPFSINLYCRLVSHLLNNQENRHIYFEIITIIENDKTRILQNIDIKSFKYKKSSAETLNPYYNIFTLIPNTRSISINEVSMQIFNIPSKNIRDFINICKSQKYGLIILNKQIVHPITYNNIHLLDSVESHVFKSQHKDNYGVDIPVIKRYDTINRINSKSKWNFSIDTHVLTFKDYEKEKDMFVIILDSLSPDTYRIMTNYVSLNKKYFVRISSIQELYVYCSNSNILQPTRINRFNTICISKAMDNIYAPISIDMEKIKVISNIIDPKYLKNQIYLRILDEFKSIINKKGVDIKDNYTYSSIVRNEQFLNIFSDIIIEEFYTFLYSTYTEYVSGFINISEILCTFISDIYIHQRTFVKEINDYFKDNLLKFEDGDITQNVILLHFDKMIQTALTKIITPDSNIYQNVLYKINLLKNSLL